MSWKDNTVSMGLVDSEEFGGKLATVTVSERRIAVEPHDVEDWERIFRELGEGIVLEEVRWEEVKDVSKTIDDLYYPHINIRFQRQEEGSSVMEQERERRIFFTQQETGELEKCFKAIKKFWHQWRQHKVTVDDRFPDEVDSDTEEVELEDALQNAGEPDTAEPAAEPVAADDGPEQDGSDSESGQDEPVIQVEEQDAEQADSRPEQAAQPVAADEGTEAAEDEAESDAEEDDADEDDDELSDDEIDDVVDRFMEE